MNNNENNVQSRFNKTLIIGVFAFVLILGSGIFLMKTGFNVTEKTKVEEQQKTNDENISELEKEKAELEEQEITLRAAESEEFKTNGFSEEYYRIENELSNITDRIVEIEFEISKIKNGYYDNKASIDAGVSKGIYFLFPGIAICISSFVILVIYIKKSFTNPLASMTSSSKEMLEDFSDIAIKMAKELNPTYEEFKCPNCGASLDPTHTETKKCEYCGTQLYRTVKKTK